MIEKPKILLAEDDVNMGILLLDFLESEGFEVKLCADGEQALQAFLSQTFHLCLLDVMLPKMDGFTLARKMKATHPEIPILFATAKSLKADKLTGYGLGADDYITKPFDEEELLWKIRAVIRRHSKNEVQVPLEPIRIGNSVFDFPNQTLTVFEKVKRITERESAILYYLCRHRNNVVKREQLLKEVWGENDYFLGRSLDVFITKLRKYLKDDPLLSIENVFGVGFIFKTEDGRVTDDR